MTKLADGYPIRRQLADAIDEALAKMLGGQISVDVSAARAISSALREGERLRGALEAVEDWREGLAGQNGKPIIKWPEEQIRAALSSAKEPGHDA